LLILTVGCPALHTDGFWQFQRFDGIHTFNTFFFLIVDTQTRAVLFAGAESDPTQ
jgi:hypothetical protein